MVDHEAPDNTRLLNQAAHGSESATDDLVAAVYDELKQRAAAYLRQERNANTLHPTALVHEAYEKLIDQTRIDWQGRNHFLAFAAVTMRRILVDHARRRGSDKRGGQRERITLADLDAIQDVEPPDVLAIHEVLARLEALNPRHARIVEMRFFAGMNLDEIATVLGVSARTLKRDWRVARAWFLGELEPPDAS